MTALFYSDDSDRLHFYTSVKLLVVRIRNMSKCKGEYSRSHHLLLIEIQQIFFKDHVGDHIPNKQIIDLKPSKRVQFFTAKMGETRPKNEQTVLREKFTTQKVFSRSCLCYFENFEVTQGRRSHSKSVKVIQRHSGGR